MREVAFVGSGLIRGGASFEGYNLVVTYYLGDERGGLCWE